MHPGCLLLLVPALACAAPPPFSSQPLEHSTSWLGNSYPGVPHWVQQDIRAMAVTADGTVFTNVEWEEGGGNVGEYRDGALVRYARHTHGWGAGGGLAVAVNKSHVFLGLSMNNEGGGLNDPSTWPPKGKRWFGVSRRLRSDISRAAPFPGAKGGKGDTLKDSFLVVAEVPDQSGHALAGLVATGHELIVSEPNAGEIQVFDAESMSLLRRTPVTRAGPLALAADGTIAMLESPGETPSRVLRIIPDGSPGVLATLPPGTVPSAICFDANRLLVADTGPAQQILIYTPQGGGKEMTLTDRFGEPGGIFAARGVFGPRRLHDVRAIGCDANHNLYLAHDGQTGGGGTVLEAYSLSDSSLRWQLFGLTFVDLADLDPASPADMFTKEERFHFDFAKPAGREWSYRAFTVDRFRFPQDPRIHLWSAGAWIRRCHDRRFLFVHDMNSEHLQIYRFSGQAGDEAAIPSGFFAKRHVMDKKDPAWLADQPAAGEWIWRDTNGNGAFDTGEFLQPDPPADAPAAQGWWVDELGGVWLATESAGIRHWPLQGLDSRGNPVWDYPHCSRFPAPPEFSSVKRIRYLPASDTLYLAGTTAEHKNQHWKPSGPVIARYDNWLRGKATLRWCIVAPYADGSKGHGSCEPMGFDVAGELLFVPYTGASKPHAVKHGRVEVFRCDDGSNIGHLDPPAEVGEIGLQDIRECLVARRLPNGETIVFLEDDYKAKVLVYRLRPLPDKTGK